MTVLRNGDFQEADRSTGNPGEAFFMAMSAASVNEAGYLISYDWYIDTAPGNMRASAETESVDIVFIRFRLVIVSVCLKRGSSGFNM